MFKTRFFSLGFCILGFVSYFVLRISYFLFLDCLIACLFGSGYASLGKSPLKRFSNGQRIAPYFSLPFLPCKGRHPPF